VRNDPDGARLLETYLDRRFPGWRAAAEADPDGAGNVGSGTYGNGAMSEDQAYKVLGLQKGAEREAIVHAHRALMQKLHPDHGGSTDLAARVNEAQDVLLRRHF
jgi:DnaJ-domain-containing protein 1